MSTAELVRYRWLKRSWPAGRYGSRYREFDAGPCPVIGEWDATMLDRVLGNLLSNALKFSPDTSPRETPDLERFRHTLIV